jgi:RNA polymerase sigma-70 factor (ECF subfamily)
MTAIEFNYQLTSLSQSLERFAFSLTSNTEDARDLLQETFVKAISYRDKFAEDTNLKAWTFTIMKNTFINNYRRLVKSNTTFDHTDDLYYLNLNRESGFETPEATISAKEIEKHIDRLEDEFRVPFQMHLQGYKYKEIADNLDLKIGTVKSRIFFTRKRLMNSLGIGYN